MTEPFDMYMAALKMVGSLGIVLLILFASLYGVRRYLQKDAIGSKNKLIQPVAIHYLGGKKSITVLRIQGVLLVLGVSNDRVSLLARLKENNLPNTPKIIEKNEEEGSFLASLLKSLPINRKEGETFDDKKNKRYGVSSETI